MGLDSRLGANAAHLVLAAHGINEVMTTAEQMDLLLLEWWILAFNRGVDEWRAKNWR